MAFEKIGSTANPQPPEITIKVIVLSILLTIILALTNTYLALKIGVLTSASIPAAILAMGILRFFKHSNILENNLVQTAASAGEAVAGGIVYTIPALIIIHFWSGFSYWENLAIALLGGLLGVLFSIPLRRVLMTNKQLPFPEGRAIAEVLQIGAEKGLGLSRMLLGGIAGAMLELAQTGFQMIANSIQKWLVFGHTYVGFGVGFATTLVGAGYLMGARLGLSLFLGAILGWLLGIPALSTWMLPMSAIEHGNATAAVMAFWHSKMCYLGVGAMLTAGVYTLLSLLPQFMHSLRASLTIFGAKQQLVIRTEQDMPMIWVLLGILGILVALYGFFAHLFQLSTLGIAELWHMPFLLGCLFYVLIIGFVFAAICGYFSGLVGVSASPGSAIIIAGICLAALGMRAILELGGTVQSEQLQHAAAITIILGAIITGAACIANDNVQDLKVGHLIGATPWKQQIMLMLGVVVAAAVIPPVMNLLFQVYGIADVLPHAGMDPGKTLAAPPAAMMAAVAQAVFQRQLPWDMVGIGISIMLPILAINHRLTRKGQGLSVLGVAMGIYLPLTTSMALALGASFAWMTQRYLKQHRSTLTVAQVTQRTQRGTLLACGLVCGAALMDIILAIPFAMTRNPDVLRLLPSNYESIAPALAILTSLGLGIWFYRSVCSKEMS